MDTAHKQTDKIIQATNRKSKATYLNAYRNIRDKFTELYSKIEINADMNAQEKITEANKYDRVQKLTDYIVDELLETNKTALKGINNDLNGIYQLNYNAMAEDFKKDGIEIDKINKTETKEEVKDNANPYNEIAIDTATDKANIKRSINNSLLSSILKVASVGSALAGIRQVFEKNLESSARITETQATRLENLALYDVMKVAEPLAEKKNKVMVKIWRTTGDDKVRDAHARADGQEAKMDEPFYVGGERLMYPGDFTGSAGNIINCRCWIDYKFVEK